MTVCETLPLCPDTVVNADDYALTEPIEIGPFRSGRIFVRVLGSEDAAPTVNSDVVLHERADVETSDLVGDPVTINAHIGISPTGYEDWEAQWTTFDQLVLDSPGMYSHPIENAGNWLRLRFQADSTGEPTTLLAWYVTRPLS